MLTHGNVDCVLIPILIANCFSSAPPVIILQAGVVQVLPGYRLSCPVSGTPPIHIALMWNSTVLVNATDTASIVVEEEGNYTCIANSSYGSDVREFSVVFNGETFYN